jgi:hypothetical protein
MFNGFCARLKAEELPVSEPHPSMAAMNDLATGTLSFPAAAKLNTRAAGPEYYPNRPMTMREMLLSLEDSDDDMAPATNYPWRQNSVASHAIEKPSLDV